MLHVLWGFFVLALQLHAIAGEMCRFRVRLHASATAIATIAAQLAGLTHQVIFKILPSESCLMF